MLREILSTSVAIVVVALYVYVVGWLLPRRLQRRSREAVSRGRREAGEGRPHDPGRWSS